MSRIHPPSDTPLTEADMQGFADGNLPPERAARVRNYLGARPREAERIAFYRQLNMQMRHAFEGAFPQRTRETRGEREQTATFPSAPSAPSAIGRFFARPVGAALIGIVLVVLSASGWFFASRVTTEMLNAAAVMALMNTSSERASDAPTLTDPHSVDLAPLGLKLVGETTRHPNALASIDVLDYRNADGEAVVLLSSSALFAADKPHWSAQRIGHARLLMWTVNGTRYVLAGRADTHGLMRAADALTAR